MLVYGINTKPGGFGIGRQEEWWRRRSWCGLLPLATTRGNDEREKAIPLTPGYEGPYWRCPVHAKATEHPGALLHLDAVASAVFRWR